MVRNDRSVRRGGGVAIYYKKGLKINVVAKSDNLVQIEYLFIEIVFPAQKILFGVIYEPPKIKENEKLHNLLTELSLK